MSITPLTTGEKDVHNAWAAMPPKARAAFVGAARMRRAAYNLGTVLLAFVAIASVFIMPSIAVADRFVGGAFAACTVLLVIVLGRYLSRRGQRK